MRQAPGTIERRSPPGAWHAASQLERASASTSALALAMVLALLTLAATPAAWGDSSTAPAATATAATTGPAAAPAQPLSTAALRLDVEATERGFARSMADRDLAAFGRFLADEAVFFQGPQRVLRGRGAVLEVWKRYFETPVAPFSWEPDDVEVLASGTLAATSGPVRNPAGQVIGRFHSIWRREADGHWRIVFDRGESPCDCRDTAPAPAPAP